MKTAIIKSRNDITGLFEVEGKAEILTCMDRQQERSFYEVKFIGDNTTHCRWVDNESITEREEIN